MLFRSRSAPDELYAELGNLDALIVTVLAAGGSKPATAQSAVQPRVAPGATATVVTPEVPEPKAVRVDDLPREPAQNSRRH